MSDHDDKVRGAYGELPRDEPPEALDRAIMSSARHALERPRVRRQWAVPVSVAAVLVLALGITLRMQREEPGIETSLPSREQPRSQVEPPKVEKEDLRVAPSAPAQAPEPQARPQRQAKPVQSAAPLEKKKALPLERDEALTRKDAASANVASEPEAKIQAAPAAAPPAAPAPAAAAAQSAPAAMAPAAAPALRAKRVAQGFAADVAKQADADPLRKELERIVQLRREGRDAEADKALEKFRKENPDYRIPDALWEQVKPR